MQFDMCIALFLLAYYQFIRALLAVTSVAHSCAVPFLTLIVYQSCILLASANILSFSGQVSAAMRGGIVLFHILSHFEQHYWHPQPKEYCVSRLCPHSLLLLGGIFSAYFWPQSPLVHLHLPDPACVFTFIAIGICWLGSV